jgi:hypothetical protein
MSRQSTIRTEGQWYKGNTHAHTNISDGMVTPENLVGQYKALGYDFTAITDHRVYGIHPELSSPEFLVLPGVELDVPVKGDEAFCHHIVGLGLPDKNNLKHGERITYDPVTNVRQLTAYLQANGNICLYAHPYWSHVYQEELLEVPGLIGMEIYNHTCEVSAFCGFSDTWYDRLLWNGRRVWCLASDDTHQRWPDIGGGFIRVKADDLTHEAIISSILAGSFHASEGPLIDQFFIENGKAHIVCSPCCHIGLQTNSYPGAAILDPSGNLTEGSFVLKGSEKYVRIVCKDEKGKKAWSQPIWLD